MQSMLTVQDAQRETITSLEEAKEMLTDGLDTMKDTVTTQGEALTEGLVSAATATAEVGTTAALGIAAAEVEIAALT